MDSGTGGPARRRARRAAVLAMVLAAAAVAAAAWWNRAWLGGLFFRPEAPAAAELARVREEVQRRAADPQRLAQGVAALHERLNQLAGWDRIRNLDWEAFRRDEPAYTRQLDELASQAGDPRLHADLQVAAELLRRAAAGKDDRALLYAHRILHDLDCRVFQVHCTETYWGYTVTLEGPGNPALRYLGEGHPVEQFLYQQGILPNEPGS